MGSDSGRPHFFSPLKPLLISVVLLTLAFAPVNQFYLAWVGLAPWLVILDRCRSKKGAFFWSWVGGTLFFSANMWWIVAVTVPGMIALMIYCGIFWGLAGLIIFGGELMRPGFLNVLGIAAVWTGCEWIRGHLFTGLPWGYVGHSQTGFLAMCQVADWGGVYAVTFWVICINGLIALVWLNLENLRRIAGAAIGVGILVVAVLVYGIFRIQQTAGVLLSGPVVAVIQANLPQTNSGEKSESDDDRLQFHLQQTREVVAKSPEKIDLVVWSETMLPPLNHETIDLMDRIAPGDKDAQSARRSRDAVAAFAAENHVAMLVGGDFAGDWAVRDGYWISRDRRNSAYLFGRDGKMLDGIGQRYDKIHLVPFGEFIPFKESIPFLYRMFISLGPKYYEDYELQSGDENALTVFQLPMGNGVERFVTPICFEDMDGNICARMFRPENGGGKRADFLVNLTNDGWFAGSENAVHFQMAVFRDIENRVPGARSVNTGISGFIDSTGRASHLLTVRTAGWSVMRLMLDSRVTFYTRFGDVFAVACLAGMGIVILISILGKKSQKVLL